MQVRFRARSLGFTLTEILVAMVIALIGVIVIFQVFSVSEGTKRTTTSGGDAQQAGAIALFSMERDLRQAGYGINSSTDLGCTVSAYDADAGGAFPMTLAPVVITSNAGTTPDAIRIMYGNSSQMVNQPTISANQPSTPNNASSLVRVNNRYGFTPGDVIVMADQSGTPRCLLAQVTSLPTAPGSTDQVLHDPGNFLNANGVTTSARYNHPTALGVLPFTTNGRVYNLGPQPTVNTYTITNNQLTIAALGAVIGAGGPPAIADNVVMFKAQYGMDDGGNNGTISNPTGANDGIIDQFVTTTPATAQAWTQLLAVRLVIVARSTLPEKPSPAAAGVCDTSPPPAPPSGSTLTALWGTTGPLVWATAGYAGVTLDLTADPNWRCYRYKIFQTTVPLRNQLWRQS